VGFMQGFPVAPDERVRLTSCVGEKAGGRQGSQQSPVVSGLDSGIGKLFDSGTLPHAKEIGVVSGGHEEQLRRWAELALDQQESAERAGARRGRNEPDIIRNGLESPIGIGNPSPLGEGRY